jgi:hypothetical protein
MISKQVHFYILVLVMHSQTILYSFVLFLKAPRLLSCELLVSELQRSHIARSDNHALYSVPDVV